MTTDQLTTALDGVADAVFILDDGARVRHVNAPGLELLGSPAEEVLGREFLGLGPDPGPPPSMRGLQRSLQESAQDQWSGEIAFRGRRFHVRARPGPGGTVVVLREAPSASRPGAPRTRGRDGRHRTSPDGPWRKALRAARTGTWLFEGGAGLVHWDEESAALFGLSGRHRLPIQDVMDRIHREDRRGILRLLREADAPAPSRTYEVDFRLGDGPRPERWLRAVGRSTLRPGGVNGGSREFAGVVFDITDRRRAEEEVRRSAARERARAEELEALMESVPAGVLLAHDPEARWITGNRMAYRVLRRPPASNLARSSRAADPAHRFRLLQDGREVPPERLPARRAAGGEHLHGEEYEVRFGDGRRLHIVANGVPLRDEEGRNRGGLVAVVEITDRKRGEDRLQELNRTLEQRAAERAAEAERRAEQLQLLAAEVTDAEQRERRRLAQLLHDELQQILVAAQMRIQLARTMGDPLGGEAGREAEGLLARAIEASRSLSVELAPPVLYDMGLPSALEWLGRWAEERYGLEVRVEAPELEAGVSEQLRVLLFEAVRELLLNVVKHAETRRARVTLEADVRTLHLHVTDRGRGFDLETVEGRGRPVGYGLLSLRERLQLMGGEVEVRTAPGEGTAIRIAVPVGWGEAPDTKEAPERVPVPGTVEGGDPRRPVRRRLPDRPARVLLVDDHEVLRQGLAKLFAESSDLEVVGEAATGEEAVELVRTIEPDLVVMDISLPGMSGLEATRRIADEMPHIRIVGLSIHEERDVAEALRAAGASAYLSKAEPSRRLLESIRQVLAV